MLLSYLLKFVVNSAFSTVEHLSNLLTHHTRLWCRYIFYTCRIMRVGILILVLAVAGTQGVFFDDFKDLGKNLLDKLVDTGKEAAGS